MSVKISRLEIENVKRVKAVSLEPSLNGLTVIGGANNQGKTSVLDSIAWALGGEKYRPSMAQREGSYTPPTLNVTLSNGLKVTRSGKNGALKVTDTNGKKGGQQLLNEFIEQLALDLPKFMESTPKEKAQTLLQILGIGDTLAKMEYQESELYSKRHTIGQIADQKKKFANEMVSYPDVPNEPISASELITQQQTILLRNAENQRKRENLSKLEQSYNEVQMQIETLQNRLFNLSLDLENARKSAIDLHDESTAELEQNIANVDSINMKVRANLDKFKAEDEAQEYRNQYDELTSQIEKIRMDKLNLLHSAKLPLDGLSVEKGELLYNGQKWDNMSGSEQLKVSTAIVKCLKPDCGFVLIDKLEQMDLNTLKEFGEWLSQEGLQAIATRVSTGDECSIIIQDGCVVQQKKPSVEVQPKKWVAGTF